MEVIPARYMVAVLSLQWLDPCAGDDALQFTPESVRRAKIVQSDRRKGPRSLEISSQKSHQGHNSRHLNLGRGEPGKIEAASFEIIGRDRFQRRVWANLFGEALAADPNI